MFRFIQYQDEFIVSRGGYKMDKIGLGGHKAAPILRGDPLDERLVAAQTGVIVHQLADIVFFEFFQYGEAYMYILVVGAQAV
ncbi:MAG: hypothetical protein ACOYOD_10535 [Saprospiraceae bacterium]